MVDQIINEVLSEMQTKLSYEQLKDLESILVRKFHGLVIQKECTDIAVLDDSWERVIKRFVATKRLENCAESTLKQYIRVINILKECIHKPIQDVTTNDLRYYLAIYREGKDGKQRSLSYIDTLRHYFLSFFGFASDEGLIPSNPAKRLLKIKVPRKIKYPYTGEEYEKLKSSAKSQRDKAIIEVLYSTACRIGEITSLNISDIEWHGRDAEAVVYGQKGKAERRVYLKESAALHLRWYLAQRKDSNPALFVSKRGCKRLTNAGVQAMLRKLGDENNIHAHPHEFRRTMLTNLAEHGMAIQEVQRYAGHKDISTTMIYVNVSEQSVINDFKKCANF